MLRRDFIRLAGASTLVLAANPIPVFPAKRHLRRRFAPVKVSRDRLIRTVVGLRPYRSEGFVVKAERAGEKLIIHNYGHGGAGISLSWGSAALALELAGSISQTRFAVLGCGVNGLSVARLLQRHGGIVTIYAKDLPPETTSNMAGGLWYPTSSYNADRASSQFLDQFHRACQIANRAFQTLVGDNYGVRWIETYQSREDEEDLQRELLGGADLYPATKTHHDPRHYFGFPYVRQFTTMLIEPPVYLNALLRDFYLAGGKVNVKEFRDLGEITALAEPVVFNCTGLGSRTLFNDTGLIPVRGQLEVLLPQPEVDYCYLAGAPYMFPRRDGIVLGGTFQHDRWQLDPDPDDLKTILDSNAEIAQSMRH
jgi:glycine/D-amino acid oxidase-like deaminating enzyme